MPGENVLPDVIREAAQKPLGILALMICLLAWIAYTFFGRHREHPGIRIGVFAALFAGVAVFAFAVVRLGGQRNIPPLQSTVADATDTTVSSITHTGEITETTNATDVATATSDTAGAESGDSIPLPALLSQRLLLECRHRGGNNCFAEGGFVITAPPDNGVGIAKFRVPRDARYFLATLTEYSGTSCDGGYAISHVKVGDVDVPFEQGRTTNQAVSVEIPNGVDILELSTQSPGSAWCNDPAWMNARFSSTPE